jgi:hypothetical protein
MGDHDHPELHQRPKDHADKYIESDRRGAVRATHGGRPMCELRAALEAAGAAEGVQIRTDRRRYEAEQEE